MARSSSDRSAQITVKLDPVILSGLRDIASRIGMAPTTVAAMAIGDYVTRTQTALGSQAIVAEAIAKELAKVIGAPIAASEHLKALFTDDQSPEKQADWTHDD